MLKKQRTPSRQNDRAPSPITAHNPSPTPSSYPPPDPTTPDSVSRPRVRPFADGSSIAFDTPFAGSIRAHAMKEHLCQQPYHTHFPPQNALFSDSFLCPFFSPLFLSLSLSPFCPPPLPYTSRALPAPAILVCPVLSRMSSLAGCISTGPRKYPNVPPSGDASPRSNPQRPGCTSSRPRYRLASY